MKEKTAKYTLLPQWITKLENICVLFVYMKDRPCKSQIIISTLK